MRFERLRLCGFKSFVEPVDVEIKPGLTGVVGPNGCGKSNLVEGLRWLMGANSAKAMRASGMDEVIFAGTTGGRPARSWAEVTLEIDNAERRAPAAFNDSDTLTVTRRVMRRADGSISAYSINGKEVRARDVQMLFADASTGATSPSLVRQGQIAELIAAKPTDRRRFLEEAAGVTGLSARRHEAQLRLKAAADNLERLDDVIGELDLQSDQLARQARKATRYKEISDEIKSAETALTASRVRDAVIAHQALQRKSDEQMLIVAATTEDAARADREASALADSLEAARATEREAAQAMADAEADLKAFESAASLRREAAEERQRTLERCAADEARETSLLTEADEAIATAKARIEQLENDIAAETTRRSELEQKALEADTALAEAEKTFEAQQHELAEAEAEARAAQRDQIKAEDLLRSLRAEKQKLDEKAAHLPLIHETDIEAARQLVDETENLLRAAEEHLQSQQADADAQRETMRAAQEAQREAKERLSLLDREAAVLAPLVPDTKHQGSDGALLGNLKAPEGLQKALASALGAGLHAALGEDGDRSWTDLGASPIALPPLPEGAEPLASLIYAPTALTRRLASIGVIDGLPGDDQLAELHSGQMLVNREGQVWRWDGFRSTGEADAHLHELLAASSRLSELEQERSAASSAAARATLVVETGRASLEIADEILQTAKDQEANARAAHDKAKADAEAITREAETNKLRRENVEEQLTVNASALVDAEARLTNLPQIEQVSAQKKQHLEMAREARDEARRQSGRARAQAADHRRASAERRDVLRQSNDTIKAWSDRRTAASARLGELEREHQRLEADRRAAGDDQASEVARLADLTTIADGHKELWGQSQASVANFQEQMNNADRDRREAEAKASAAREAAAEITAELRGAQSKLEEAQLEAGVTAEEAAASIGGEASTATVDELTRRLTKLEREREGIGAVNLLAAEEKEQVDERLFTMRRERGDCDAAANQLRNAVNSINREGRQRLLAAFDTVNGHFRDLFTSLFGGGEAQLRFVDSDDPLAAGLEIFACPPGKKLQSLSLMSGGEQALTATALIFAAFKTNPAPICVLDEVDAPLDDANVERFCNLLTLMASSSSTRFLVVTHHPLTMSRMDRLYGVTMMERGVSQLFSLDLESARRLAA
ncbi:MAG: chromosome segregation protein SMC [Pseudomonadota bacterium]